MKDLITIGKIIGSSGLSGRIKVVLYTESPHILETGAAVHIGQGKKSTSSLAIKRILQRGKNCLIEFEGIDTVDAANLLKGQYLYLPREMMAEPDEGEYYWHDIIGLAVITEEGEELGYITSILPTGSNDVYICEGTKGEILLPAIEEVIKSIDIGRGVIIVEMLEGLVT